MRCEGLTQTGNKIVQRHIPFAETVSPKGISTTDHVKLNILDLSSLTLRVFAPILSIHNIRLGTHKHYGKNHKIQETSTTLPKPLI